jgi:hypothetical protein
MATEFRSQADTPITDGAAVQVTTRHNPCRWRRPLLMKPYPRLPADRFYVIISAVHATRPLRMASPSNPNADTSLAHGAAVQSAKHRHAICKRRRSPGHPLTLHLQTASQLRPQSDTHLTGDIAVQATRRHVHCGCRHTPGETPTSP